MYKVKQKGNDLIGTWADYSFNIRLCSQQLVIYPSFSFNDTKKVTTETSGLKKKKKVFSAINEMRAIVVGKISTMEYSIHGVLISCGCKTLFFSLDF